MYDVYGFDDELLDMVPKPVLAVVFLFPYKPQVIRLFVFFDFTVHLSDLFVYEFRRKLRYHSIINSWRRRRLLALPR